MTIETQLDDARLANATLREKWRQTIVEQDELRLEIKRLRTYEDQCNGLSQKFCKSLIIEGVPAALSALDAAEKEIERLRETISEYEGTDLSKARRVMMEERILREAAEKELEAVKPKIENPDLHRIMTAMIKALELEIRMSFTEMHKPDQDSYTKIFEAAIGAMLNAGKGER